jgi:lipid-A-disaccharide synthase
LIIGILAGEPSGDNLGAGLMHACREACPEIEFVGVGGPRMLDEGLVALAPMDELTAHGFAEPFKRFPSLVKTLRILLHHYRAEPPAAFLGIDFNVFNFLIERILKRRGVPTAHYVSPSVYAWRRGRVRRIARSTDLLLTLYPFEPEFYANSAVKAVFVGHPLADEIAPDAGDAQAQSDARRSLGIDPGMRCIAVLPGSRLSEVKLMLQGFLGACDLVRRELPSAVFVIPCVDETIERRVGEQLGEFPDLQVVTYQGNARRALTACEAAIVKSGTGTLEAMLLHRPMVVSYRLSELTYQVVRRLISSRRVALPNILAGREIVPEVMQHDATPQALAENLLAELDKARHEPEYLAAFERLHLGLRQGADKRAAETLLCWLEARRGQGGNAGRQGDAGVG